MRLINQVVSLTALSLIVSCNVSTETTEAENEETIVIEESKPADSTDAMAPVSLAFGTTSGLGLMLDETTAEPEVAPTEVAPTEVAPSVKVGDNIELTYAKFNIAKIKVKAEKAQTDDEKKLEKKEDSSESDAAADVETLTESEETISLAVKPEDADGNVKGQKLRKEKMRQKVKEHREELKDKEKDSLEKEVKSDKSTKFSGPYVFDAVLGKIEGDGPSVDLVDGTYRRVEFQLKRDFASEEGEPLLGNVFAMQGTVMKDGASVPFVIDWHVALNFRLAGDNGLTIATDEENALVIDFNLAKMFEGIDFSKAVVDEGTIYVNKKSNKAIMKQLHRNIKMSSGFGKDKNNDGKIGTDERAGQGEDTTDASNPEI